MAVESANLGSDARAFAGVLSELAAADELITELVAENEALRSRLTRLERAATDRVV